MRVIKEFRIGSGVFFDNYLDYVFHDTDKLCIMDSFPIKKTNVLNLKTGLEDIFFYKNMDKSGFIEDTLKSKQPLRVGKFLVPAFVNHIGLDIKDLFKLSYLFNQLDDNHQYEKIIYDAYIENNGFFLTKKQRDKAYKKYKEERGL
jgi:hypothetical protein